MLILTMCYQRKRKIKEKGKEAEKNNQKVGLEREKQWTERKMRCWKIGFSKNARKVAYQKLKSN